MTFPQKVLADLLFGASSTSYIAERTDQPESYILAVLKDEEIAGTVVSRPLHTFHVWSLTNEGRAIAETFPKEPKFPD